MNIIKNKRPVILGIFIVIGLSIFVITIFTLGGQKKTFVKSYNIHAIFNDIGGLLKGGNVWFSGVKVGTVKKIAFYGKSQVQVTMNIEMEAQSHIHKDALAKIGTDGFIGNKIVVIYGGSSDMPKSEENDFIQVGNSLNTEDMLATLQANNNNLLEVTKDFKRISKKIDSGNGTISTLINDPEMANKLNATIDNLKATAANFKSVSLTSKIVLLNLKSFSGKINKPGNSINDLVTDTLIFDDINRSLTQLEKAANAVTGFSTNLKNASARLNQQNNVVGMLLNDSLTAVSVRITLKNLETGSHKLDEDLEALQHNFLFRGFFRKKEKANKF
jgi:phospholipid/cholesterol/gamma-HCH transport system substrate-binding protein